jgi:hypothetical protein
LKESLLSPREKASWKIRRNNKNDTRTGGPFSSLNIWKISHLAGSLRAQVTCFQWLPILPFDTHPQRSNYKHSVKGMFLFFAALGPYSSSPRRRKCGLAGWEPVAFKLQLETGRGGRDPALSRAQGAAGGSKRTQRRDIERAKQYWREYLRGED